MSGIHLGGGEGGNNGGITLRITSFANPFSGGFSRQQWEKIDFCQQSEILYKNIIIIKTYSLKVRV